MEVLGPVSLIWIVFALLSVLQQALAASYLYINKNGTFIEGRQLCQKFGLDLAKVSSDQELEDLHAMYQNISGATVAWLGIQYEEPVFLWPDGSEVQVTAWNVYTDDEPDGLTNSRCAVVKWSIMLWHTRRCTSEYPALCGPYQQEDVPSPEIQDSTFSIWQNGQVLDAEPTVTKPETSIGACAKDCLKIGNCFFFSLDGEVCNIYSNVTTITTSETSDNSRIWKRDFAS